MKKFYSAEASLKLAIENNPKNRSVYYDLALTHIGLKSYPGALDDLTQMIQLDLTRISAAKFLIEKDEEFSLYWRENSSKYPALAQAIPPLVVVVNRNVKMVLISEGKFIMGSDPTLDLAIRKMNNLPMRFI